MRPGQAVALLSGEWPPPNVEHWPPRDKSRWKPGMQLQGFIEAVMTLPRPDGSKHRGEPYLALYIRRLTDGQLVMWHGWHTAAEDVPPMQPRPGLLFTGVYRGEEDSGFENFKYLVTPYDPAQDGASADGATGPTQQAPMTTARQAERDNGQTGLDAELGDLGLTRAKAVLRLRRTAEFQDLKSFDELAPQGLAVAIKALAHLVAKAEAS